MPQTPNRRNTSHRGVHGAVRARPWRAVILLVALVLAATAGTAGCRPCPPSDNPVPPPENGALVGAYVPSGAGKIAGFDNKTGKRHGVFTRFFEVRENAPDEGGVGSAKQLLEECRRAKAVPMFTIEPVYADNSRLLSPDDIAWLRAFAVWLGKTDTPAFIRFAHEMNGSWYPWGAQAVPDDVYIGGFRLAHDIFAAHAPRAAMVWAPSQNWGENTEKDYARWYPGDEYVDWVGLTTYQWHDSGLDDRQFYHTVVSGSGEQGNFYREFAVGHNKPMMIAETGCGEDDLRYYDDKGTTGRQREQATYGASAQTWWIEQVYGTADRRGDIERSFPRIKAVIWFDSADPDMGDLQLGGSIEEAGDGLTAYARGVSRPYWVEGAPRCALPKPGER